jgi:enamine deaminase RidA (YjgF/YER057c/UK114 family)
MVTGPSRTVYVGGQNAADETGHLVGSGDIKAKSVQAIRNVQTAV